MITGVEADLLDQDHYAVHGPPHATFHRLRAEAPVSWHDRPDDGGFWAIPRYRDLFSVSLDQKTFSSQRRGAILRPWNEEEYQAQRGMLINLDPPEHTKYRKLVSLGFSGRMIRRLESHVRDITTGILDQVAEAGECDFVDAISAELPLRVIVEVAGVPVEDRRRVLVLDAHRHGVLVAACLSSSKRARARSRSSRSKTSPATGRPLSRR